MKKAPPGAVYVWPDVVTSWYPAQLSRAVRRPDLRVVPLCRLVRFAYESGVATAQVVLDPRVSRHKLTATQSRALDRLRYGVLYDDRAE